MQLDAKIGPNVINVSRCMSDIVTIAIAYFIISLGYSSGIAYILKVNRESLETEATKIVNQKDSKELVIEDSRSPITFNQTFKSLFWQIVDDGTKPEAIPNEGILGEFVYIIYFTYNILVLVVLLNLLIAIMNSTVQRLEERKQQYWKYTRTGIWIDYFDDSMELPLPYSPLHIFKALITVFKRLKKIHQTDSYNDCNFSEDQMKHRLVYIELIKDLSTRLKETENDMKSESKVNSQFASEESELDFILTPNQTPTPKRRFEIYD